MLSWTQSLIIAIASLICVPKIGEWVAGISALRMHSDCEDIGGNLKSCVARTQSSVIRVFDPVSVYILGISTSKSKNLQNLLAYYLFQLDGLKAIGSGNSGNVNCATHPSNVNNPALQQNRRANKEYRQIYAIL